MGLLMGAQARKPTNLSLDRDLLDAARALDINVSRAAEAGILAAVRMARAETWKRENAQAIASSNSWVEANGLPLDRYRLF